MTIAAMVNVFYLNSATINYYNILTVIDPQAKNFQYYFFFVHFKFKRKIWIELRQSKLNDNFILCFYFQKNLQKLTKTNWSEHNTFTTLRYSLKIRFKRTYNFLYFKRNMCQKMAQISLHNANVFFSIRKLKVIFYKNPRHV